MHRLDRRKALTRAALLAAARELLASRDPAGVSIQEITDTADVGFGSFYNHFETKVELFDAAIEEVLEEQGALFDALTAEMEDPADVFARSVRMTVRMTKRTRRSRRSSSGPDCATSTRRMAWPGVRCAICGGAWKAAGSTLVIRWLRWPAPAAPCWRAGPHSDQSRSGRAGRLRRRACGRPAPDVRPAARGGPRDRGRAAAQGVAPHHVAVRDVTMGTLPTRVTWRVGRETLAGVSDDLS